MLNSKVAEDLTEGMTEGLSSLLSLFSIMRAQHLMYWTLHWQTKGTPFYGNHLLFQRIYESLQEQIDGLAEKIVGIFDPHLVDLSPSIEKIKYWVDKWSEESNFHQRGLNSEEDFMRVAREAYDQLKGENKLTLGLDDFIMATSSDHETNVYLLKQVLRG